MILGSRKNASLIHKFFHDDSDNRETRVPSGWEFIGSGITRSAYLGPDGIVYKVAHAWSHWNINEAKQMKKFRNDPFLTSFNVTTPRTTLWAVDDDKVLAMDYIMKAVEVECNYDHTDKKGFKKPCSCKPRKRPCFGRVLESLYDYGIDDMFPENVHYAADGKFYLIDLGAQ